VVVDDGSPEPLAPVCARFGERVRCVRQANAGPAAARNRGVAESGADFLAFTDDDCRPDRDWLVALAGAHAGEEDRLVGGRVVNALEDDVFAAASQSLSTYLTDHFTAQGGARPFFTSNNLACSRARFDALGGFDAGFAFASEDRDLSLRWRAAGGALRYAPEAVVRHHHAMTLAGFWRQQKSYGRGLVDLNRAAEARGEALPGREPAGFYLGLLLHPLRDGGRRPLARTALTALSQAAILAGLLEARRRG
jgi:GT2 family glycosyltransferase